MQTGYRRNNGGSTHAAACRRSSSSTPSPIVQDAVEDVDPESLENLPIGLDGSAYRWTDLHGEGIPGILTEQAGAWFYKRNLSPIPAAADGSEREGEFAPLEAVATQAQCRPDRRRPSSWTWPATASPTWSSWTAPRPACTSTTRPRAGSRSARSPRA